MLLGPSLAYGWRRSTGPLAGSVRIGTRRAREGSCPRARHTCGPEARINVGKACSSIRARQGSRLIRARAGAVARNTRSRRARTTARPRNRGDRAAARQLLTSAADRGANGEEALTLLRSLDRLEAALPVPVAQLRHAPAAVLDAVQPGAARRDGRVAWVVTGILTGVLLAAVAGGYLWLVASPSTDLREPGSAGCRGRAAASARQLRGPSAPRRRPVGRRKAA